MGERGEGESGEGVSGEGERKNFIFYLMCVKEPRRENHLCKYERGERKTNIGEYEQREGMRNTRRDTGRERAGWYKEGEGTRNSERDTHIHREREKKKHRKKKSYVSVCV